MKSAEPESFAAESVQKVCKKCAWEQLIHGKSLQKVCKKSAFHEKKSAKSLQKVLQTQTLQTHADF
jgi:hypothetical protein